MTHVETDKTKITKDNFFTIVKECAKQYRKICGNTPVELIIVGGGSIVLNYSFRQSTMDFDVLIKGSSGTKEAIRKVAEIHNLPEDWMNSDFQFLSSFSPKLYEISKHYCSLNNDTISIRTVNAEYLIAMKAKSGRYFGKDMSDIIGILCCERERKNDISFEKIVQAFEYLYGQDKTSVSAYIWESLKKWCSLSTKELREKYEEIVKQSENIQSEVVARAHKQNISLTKEKAKYLAEQIIAENNARESEDVEPQIPHSRY